MTERESYMGNRVNMYVSCMVLSTGIHFGVFKYKSQIRALVHMISGVNTVTLNEKVIRRQTPEG